MRGRHAALIGSSQAHIHIVADDANSRVGSRHELHSLECPIMAAVIDEHDFERAVSHRLANAVGGELHVLFFVEARDNEGNRRLVIHGTVQPFLAHAQTY